MPDQQSSATDSKDSAEDVRKASDRLMIILGEALIDEIEKAEGEGQGMLAWQFGALDALTKQLAGAVTACVTMVRRLNLSQRDFVVLRQRVHQQLEPAVLTLLNVEVAKGGTQQPFPWPSDEKKSGHA